MANVDSELLDEIIEITNAKYDDVFRIKNSKEAIVSEKDIHKMLCIMVDIINDLKHENDELKKKLCRTEYDDYLDHLGDIADEQYEREKLGL